MRKKTISHVSLFGPSRGLISRAYTEAAVRCEKRLLSLFLPRIVFVIFTLAIIRNEP
jgi:hypothetical protein